jgi:quercetin dioxygenase-like cupin family protein
MSATAFDPARFKETTREQWDTVAAAWDRWTPMLAGLPSEEQRVVWAEVEQELAQFNTPDAFASPSEFIVGVGQRYGHPAPASSVTDNHSNRKETTVKRRVSTLVCAILLALGLPLGALADDPPPPTQRHLYRVAGLPVTGPMEMVTFVLEFAPGDATPPHTHPGLTLATVLEGEVTFDTKGAKTTYRAGQSFTELPGDVGVATNTGATRTRVMGSIVLPKGAAPSTPQPGGPSPAPTAPTALYLFRTDAIFPAGEYDVAQQVLDFAPGAQTPVHTHPGQVAVTVLAGDNTFITGGTPTVYTAGDSFVELPGVVGQARNAGSAPMAVMATYLQPKGEPLSHPIPAPPVTGTSGARAGMPSTGAGGAQRGQPPSPALGLAALGAGAILACGWLVRRREARRRR